MLSHQNLIRFASERPERLAREGVVYQPHNLAALASRPKLFLTIVANKIRASRIAGSLLNMSETSPESKLLGDVRLIQPLITAKSQSVLTNV